MPVSTMEPTDYSSLGSLESIDEAVEDLIMEAIDAIDEEDHARAWDLLEQAKVDNWEWLIGAQHAARRAAAADSHLAALLQHHESRFHRSQTASQSVNRRTDDPDNREPIAPQRRATL